MLISLLFYNEWLLMKVSANFADVYKVSPIFFKFFSPIVIVFGFPCNPLAVKKSVWKLAFGSHYIFWVHKLVSQKDDFFPLKITLGKKIGGFFWVKTWYFSLFCHFFLKLVIFKWDNSLYVTSKKRNHELTNSRI